MYFYLQVSGPTSVLQNVSWAKDRKPSSAPFTKTTGN